MQIINSNEASFMKRKKENRKINDVEGRKLNKLDEMRNLSHCKESRQSYHHTWRKVLRTISGKSSLYVICIWKWILHVLYIDSFIPSSRNVRNYSSLTRCVIRHSVLLQENVVFIIISQFMTKVIIVTTYYEAIMKIV